MRQLQQLLCLAIVLSSSLLSTSASAQFTERVTFRFRSDQITYQGPITSAFLMLDQEGGRNKVNGAQRMTCNTASPTTKRCPTRWLRATPRVTMLRLALAGDRDDKVPGWAMAIAASNASSSINVT